MITFLTYIKDQFSPEMPLVFYDDIDTKAQRIVSGREQALEYAGKKGWKIISDEIAMVEKEFIIAE